MPTSKPCPRCKTTNEPVLRSPSPEGDEHFMECVVCKYRGGIGETREEARYLWGEPLPSSTAQGHVSTPPTDDGVNVTKAPAINLAPVQPIKAHSPQPGDSLSNLAFVTTPPPQLPRTVVTIMHDGSIVVDPAATHVELLHVLQAMSQVIHTQLMVPHQRRCAAEGRPIGLYFQLGPQGPIPPA